MFSATSDVGEATPYQRHEDDPVFMNCLPCNEALYATSVVLESQAFTTQ